MARISKVESKLHTEAEALLGLERALTQDEVELVYRNWTPMAASNVTKNAAFFTPADLARGMMLYCADEGDVLDLAAGIGMLSWSALIESGNYGKHLHITAIELNPEYVAVGRKLLPQVKWINRSIFGLELLRDLLKQNGGPFDAVISNPPFGTAPAGSPEARWLKYHGPLHMMAAEVSLYMAPRAIFILPETDTPYQRSTGEGGALKPVNKTSKNLRQWQKTFPDVYIGPSCIDTDDAEWQGASPHVQMVTLEVDDLGRAPLPYPLPYSLPKEA